MGKAEPVGEGGDGKDGKNCSASLTITYGQEVYRKVLGCHYILTKDCVIIPGLRVQR
jgi:hypothetical protein